MPPCRTAVADVKIVRLHQLGITAPDVCRLGFSFYFNFPLCPSLPWLRHPTPQKYKYKAEKLHEKARFVQGVLTNFFFFWRLIGRDLAGSQSYSRENALVSGETQGLVRSDRKTWSIECNGVLDKIKNSIETLVVNVVCGVGYE